jgi:hypothetical protein
MSGAAAVAPFVLLEGEYRAYGLRRLPCYGPGPYGTGLTSRTPKALGTMPGWI